MGGGVAVLVMAAWLWMAPAATAGTLAVWHMDEQSGTVMHDAAGGHDGTIHSATLGVSGFLHTAYGFNGTKAYVSVPSASALNPGSGSFTIVAHVKLTTRPSSGDYDIVKKGDYSTGGGEYKVEILQNGQALCAFKGSLRYAQITGGPNLATNHWYTITCKKTPTQVMLTVAGKTFTNIRAVGSIANTSPIGIGAGPGLDFYDGSLDEISLTAS
jgi:hypothetical protein